MKRSKWTKDSAMDFIFRNCDVIKTKSDIIVVKNGSAGNGALGAIDYLRNYERIVIRIVSQEAFKEMG